MNVILTRISFFTSYGLLSSAKKYIYGIEFISIFDTSILFFAAVFFKSVIAVAKIFVIFLSEFIVGSPFLSAFAVI